MSVKFKFWWQQNLISNWTFVTSHDKPRQGWLHGYVTHAVAQGPLFRIMLCHHLEILYNFTFELVFCK